MATKTSTIGLNQYVGSDYVKMADFNADNLAIDNAFKEDRAKMKEIEDNVNGMELVDSKIRITDAQSHFTGTTLDKVLDEIDDKIDDTSNKVDNIDLAANKVKYTDTHTLGATDVQKAIDALATKVKALETKTQTLEQELTGQVTRLGGINTELEAEIGTPTV